MKTWQLIVLVIVIIAAGIGAMLFFRTASEDKVKNDTSSTSTTETKEENTNTATNSNTATNCSRSVNNEAMKEDIDIKNKTVTLNVEGFGDITVELYDQDAPKAVENFLRLTQSGYYDCTTFHRVSKGFVIQGGDPTGTGAGGDSAFGAEFADELNPNTPSYKEGYKKGVLAMANRGQNTNSSQFFIMLADAPQMPHLYTIFGKVTKGLDIVDKIGGVPIFPNPQMGPTDGAPQQKITITKATIN